MLLLLLLLFCLLLPFLLLLFVLPLAMLIALLFGLFLALLWLVLVGELLFDFLGNVFPPLLLTILIGFRRRFFCRLVGVLLLFLIVLFWRWLSLLKLWYFVARLSGGPFSVRVRVVLFFSFDALGVGGSLFIVWPFRILSGLSFEFLET